MHIIISFFLPYHIKNTSITMARNNIFKVLPTLCIIFH